MWRSNPRQPNFLLIRAYVYLFFLHFIELLFGRVLANICQVKLCLYVKKVGPKKGKGKKTK